MQIITINPWTGKHIESYMCDSPEQVDERLLKGQLAFESWRKTEMGTRGDLLYALAAKLEAEVEHLAEIITVEMGKPLTESRAEVKKCAWVCSYYAEHGAAALAQRTIQTEARQSFVTYEPLGLIYGIMPWNFPFWQVFRFAAPTLLAGNTVLMKHSPNVTGCAMEIQRLFDEVGFPRDVYQTAVLTNEVASSVIEKPIVKAVSLTGSERAGVSVAGKAGRVLKPSLLELGGSNAFIVMEDADITNAIDVAMTARFLNTGQSCIAAKRLLVHESVLSSFTEGFVSRVQQLEKGDPLNESTQVGPLAREDLAVEVERQVNESVAQGAVVLCGGKREGAFYEPTVLSGVRLDMPVMNTEVFGPVAPIMSFTSIDEVISMSNQSRYGLGVTIMTSDVDRVLSRVQDFEEGAVFINELVKSDPRLPFGGVKNSGYGRELSAEGIRAFVNVKTVYVK